MPFLPPHELSNLIATYGYVGIGGIVALESMGLPLPGETMLVAAALLAGATHHLDIWGVVGAAAAGAIIGDNIGFWIGREFGYWLLLRYGRFVRLDEPRIKVGQYLFMRHGGKVVFFGRFVAVLRALAAFLAGANRMDWRRFLVFNMLGGVVWASVYGFGAYFLGRQIHRIEGPVGIGFAVLAVIAFVAGLVVLRRQEARLVEAAEKALPGPLQPLRRRRDG